MGMDQISDRLQRYTEYIQGVNPRLIPEKE
jgi:hypothetical protein